MVGLRRVGPKPRKMGARRVGPRRVGAASWPPGLHTKTRTPSAHIRGLRRFKHHQNSTRRHPEREERMKFPVGERQKERTWGRRGKKKARNVGRSGVVHRRGSGAGGTRRAQNQQPHQHQHPTPNTQHPNTQHPTTQHTTTPTQKWIGQTTDY